MLSPTVFLSAVRANKRSAVVSNRWKKLFELQKFGLKVLKYMDREFYAASGGFSFMCAEPPAAPDEEQLGTGDEELMGP
jgi:hypothetical protein